MPLTNKNLLTTPLPHQMNERPVTANAARKQTGCFPSHSGHSRNSIVFGNDLQIIKPIRSLVATLRPPEGHPAGTCLHCSDGVHPVDAMPLY
jgi:hypothetical protein